MSDFRSFTRKHEAFDADGVSSVREATPISQEVSGTRQVSKMLRFDETEKLLELDAINQAQERLALFQS